MYTHTAVLSHLSVEQRVCLGAVCEAQEPLRPKWSEKLLEARQGSSAAWRAKRRKGPGLGGSTGKKPWSSLGRGEEWEKIGNRGWAQLGRTLISRQEICPLSYFLGEETEGF